MERPACDFRHAEINVLDDALCAYAVVKAMRALEIDPHLVAFLDRQGTFLVSRGRLGPSEPEGVAPMLLASRAVVAQVLVTVSVALTLVGCHDGRSMGPASAPTSAAPADGSLSLIHI